LFNLLLQDCKPHILTYMTNRFILIYKFNKVDSAKLDRPSF